jgi:glycerol-3-phosphate dehydrogenase (NAD(P)+)
MMRLGVIGSGSWGTALVKILTDNKHTVNWTVRSEHVVSHLKARHHNPNYLHSVQFNCSLLNLNTDPAITFENSDVVILVTPSAYMTETLDRVDPALFKGRKIVSAVKGMVPGKNQLLNDYLKAQYDFPEEDYFTIMGPCHAEEVAAEKLSYLTFSGSDEAFTQILASCFQGEYLNAIVNTDVYGVQYAGIMKNIYALGAGIAHGLEYGDNFQSVFIANCADEMAGFLRMAGVADMEVGVHKALASHKKSPNYAASVYLGDLLVTSYSLFSRNRTFGNMIGKGYAVKAAQLELNMVAEGYYASKSIHEINKKINADLPIADAIYEILWDHLSAEQGFKKIESNLI